ncbi:tRNA 2-thiouridine(34) synthase MnmA [Chloroflexota bacterium]
MYFQERESMKTVVAMSGGVDSSVAAALLKEEGYQVIGVTMRIWPQEYQDAGAFPMDSCCGWGTVEDARKVAHKLGIPHYVIDFRDIFARKVIADFCIEYSRGRTPNPCIRCNQYIKFDALLEKARELGAERVATGHHARIDIDEASGRFLLKKGTDRNKDQSYFLYPFSQEQLKQTLLPVGNFSKARIRTMAEELGLPVAARPESQEICFIPDDDYAGFLKGYIPQAAQPGPIRDKQGNHLGNHRGILCYTIGQRKGLGIANGEPLYVTGIEPEENTITVGSKAEAYSDKLTATAMNWISIPDIHQPITVKAKIRYRHREAEAEVSPLDEDGVYVKFSEPQLAITPGQAIVFYDGNTVVGGGTIDQTIKPGQREVSVKIGEYKV